MIRLHDPKRQRQRAPSGQQAVAVRKQLPGYPLAQVRLSSVFQGHRAVIWAAVERCRRHHTRQQPQDDKCPLFIQVTSKSGIPVACRRHTTARPATQRRMTGHLPPSRYRQNGILSAMRCTAANPAAAWSLRLAAHNRRRSNLASALSRLVMVFPFPVLLGCGYAIPPPPRTCRATPPAAGAMPRPTR